MLFVSQKGHRASLPEFDWRMLFKSSSSPEFDLRQNCSFDCDNRLG